jgi:hypothetical protein
MIRARVGTWDAVVTLLRAGRIPREVAEAPVGVGHDDEGLFLEAELDPSTQDALAAEGVPLERATGATEPVRSWLEAIPLHHGPPGDPPRVLLRLPLTRLLPLGAELLRLGCDRQQWARTGDVAWIEAVAPPWYSVLAALDASDSAVFEPLHPNVWIPLGANHPLASAIEAPPGRALVLGSPWEVVDFGSWRALYDQLDVAAPGVAVLPEPATLPRLPVRMRLVDSGLARPPTLWVLRDDGVEQIEHLLAHVPDELVERLLFVVTAGHVVLRARPSVAGPPTLEIEAERYAAFRDVPNLYGPVGTTLEPPLRRDRIRDVLAPAPHEIAWLVRDGEDFGVERVSDEAFRPLSDWVDYVLARDTTVLEGWMEATTFAFETFLDAGVEWDAPRSRARAAPSVEPEAPEDDEEDEEPVITPAVPTARALTPRPVRVVPEVERDGTAAELHAAEAAYRAEGSPLGAASVVPFQAMARLHRALGNHREASLCWVHAVWEARDPAVAVAWAEEELGALGMTVDTLRDAVLQGGSASHNRAMAAVIAAGQLEGDAALSPVFDRTTELLDVRSTWLARSRLAGDDELARVRAEDDVLGRMRDGLQVERDVPAFIRSLDADESAGVVEHLEAQLDHFRTTKRRRSVIEADPALTGVYVDLVFAWGFASLGRRERAEELAASGQQVDRADPVHDALVTAYEARIQGALDGLPRDAPLPASASAKLMGLSSFHRYQVDRLRSASGILESHERLDPFQTFERRYDDPRGPEFTTLRGETDPTVLRPALQALVASAVGHDEQERLLDGVLDFLPVLSSGDAIPLLDTLSEQVATLPAPARVRLFTDALTVAGLLGRVQRASSLTERVRGAIDELEPADLGQVTGVLARSLRSLRRVGLQDEAATLLATVRTALLVDPAAESPAWRDDPASRVTRAGVVGGLLALRDPGALAAIDGVLALLDDTMIVKHRLELTRAAGLALASAPRAAALERLPRISAHLPEITDSFNTNSHFCLSVVSYAESTVLGYADTELGSAARAWIDRSELRVRQRILG